MNPITATEKINLLKLADKTIPDVSTFPLLTLPRDWYSRQWSVDFKQEAQLCAIDPKTSEMVLPFDSFRFWFPACPKTEQDPEPFSEFMGVCRKVEGLVFCNLQFAHIVDPDHVPANSPAGFVEAVKKKHQVRICFCSKTGKTLTLETLHGGHFINNAKIAGKFGFTEKDIQLYGDMVCAPFLIMAYYYASGLFQPITSAPPREKQISKSSEWIKARTFYTVVHRRHAANSKSVQQGATVADNSCLKTAHSRRAHFRILRSEKWGASIGKRIMVRACWVGPKEWIDSESKQVYTVV
jgi:hypothetical protein